MSHTILIVDDSKLARMSVTRSLSVLHPTWKCLEAANAEEAIGRMRDSPADIVLVDFNMPGRDGLALAAELRASYPRIPIAVVSANLQDEIIARAREIGAAFLPKPLTGEALGNFLSGATLRLKTTAA